MRTPFLATLLGLSLVACAGQIDGLGEGPEENCGNGALDAEEGEGCDDGNNLDGDGCSAICTSEATPSVSATVDKQTVSTELGTNNMVTVTLTGADGFAGDVNVAASIVDETMLPVTGWLVGLNPPIVTVPLNGTATTVATVAIPSNSTLLTGGLKLDFTSSAGTSTIMSNVTALQQVTFNVNVQNGECLYSVDSTAVPVKVGTVVRFMNTGTVPLTIHVNNGNGAGIPHQPDGPGGTPGTDPGTAYTRTTTAPAPDIRWYCHEPNTDLQGENPTIVVE